MYKLRVIIDIENDIITINLSDSFKTEEEAVSSRYLLMKSLFVDIERQNFIYIDNAGIIINTKNIKHVKCEIVNDKEAYR